jgi:hypothetical protein
VDSPAPTQYAATTPEPVLTCHHLLQGTNVLRTLCEHVAKEPDHSKQQRIIACIYKMRLASRESIIEAGLFPTVVTLLRAQGHPAVPKSSAPKTMGMEVLDAQRLAVSSATVMLVRMLAWQAELAYQHQCLDLVAELLGDDPLMDVIDVEGIRWGAGMAPGCGLTVSRLCSTMA